MAKTRIGSPRLPRPAYLEAEREPTIEELLDAEEKLTQAGSQSDYSGHKNMDWIRAALRALLIEAQLRREETNAQDQATGDTRPEYHDPGARGRDD